MQQMEKAKTIGEDLMCSGKWLRLKAVKYLDERGKERVWETLERTTHGADREVDAVEIIAILKRKGQPNQLVVVKQFRPPTGQYIIELPAGLVDSKESIEVATLRELHEETGYKGKVVEESLVTFLGMAISNTTSKMMVVEIDGDLPENINPKQHLDEGEFTEVVHIPFGKILESLKEFQKQGCGIDGKISLIGIALEKLASILN